MTKVAALLRPIVEHVFLIDQAGLPMVHLSRVPGGVVAGVPVTEAAFLTKVLDASVSSEAHGTSRIPDLHVAFHSGKYMRLFVLYRGRESSRIGRRVERSVRELEKQYGAALKEWTGKGDDAADVNRALGRLWGLPDLNGASASSAVKGGGTARPPGFVSAIFRPPLDPKLR